MTMMQDISVQAATQSVFGTGVAGAVLLRGLEAVKLSSSPEVQILDDLCNGYTGGDTAVVLSVGAKGSFNGWASYEHLPYWLDAVAGKATPTGSGPYVRTWAAPTTTAPSPRLLSLIKGDTAVGAYRGVGCLPSKFMLKQANKSALQFSGDLVANKLEPTTLTGGLTKSAVTPIMGSQVASIKLDTFAGTMGATALPNCTLRYLELNIEPVRNIRYCLGSIIGNTYLENPWTGTLKLSLEFNSTSKADVDNYVAGTLVQKQVEINYASGTNLAKLQFAGTLTGDIEMFSDDDGVVTVDMELVRTYHTTFANWFKASMTNGVSNVQML